MDNTGAAIVYLHLDNVRVHDDRQGEKVLDAAAQRLQRSIRRRDLITRHGDDIIIVLSGLDHRNAALEAEQIAALLVAEFSTLTAQNDPNPLTVTIGITTFPADGHDAGQLVDVAQRRSRQGLLHRA